MLFISWNLYQICLLEFIEVHETFFGGPRYKSLRTSDIVIKQALALTTSNNLLYISLWQLTLLRNVLPHLTVICMSKTRRLRMLYNIFDFFKEEITLCRACPRISLNSVWINLGATGSESVGWIWLVWIMTYFSVHNNQHSGFRKVEKFLTRWVTINFPKETLHHEVNYHVLLLQISFNWMTNWPNKKLCNLSCTSGNFHCQEWLRLSELESHVCLVYP
jgi:hypothetical protein